MIERNDSSVRKESESKGTTQGEEDLNIDEFDFKTITQLKLNKIIIPMGKGKQIEINREVDVKEYSFKVF